MDVNIKITIEDKAFRRAAALFDLDLPTDEEVKKIRLINVDFNEIVSGDDLNQMQLAIASIMLGKYLEQNEIKDTK